MSPSFANTHNSGLTERPSALPREIEISHCWSFHKSSWKNRWRSVSFRCLIIIASCSPILTPVRSLGQKMIAKVFILSVFGVIFASGQNIAPAGPNGFNGNNPQQFPTPFNNNNPANGFPGAPPNGAFNGQPGGFGFGQGFGPQGTFDSSHGPRGSGGYQGPNGGYSYSYDSAYSSVGKIKVIAALLPICVGALLMWDWEAVYSDAGVRVWVCQCQRGRSLSARNYNWVVNLWGNNRRIIILYLIITITMYYHLRSVQDYVIEWVVICEVRTVTHVICIFNVVIWSNCE